jgi:hypothetical protein
MDFTIAATVNQVSIISVIISGYSWDINDY